MFTPEFSNTENGEYILIASHCLENEAAVKLSIEFNLARIAYGQAHVPQQFTHCRLIYDVRGQNVPETVLEDIRHTFSLVCDLEIKT